MLRLVPLSRSAVLITDADTPYNQQDDLSGQIGGLLIFYSPIWMAPWQAVMEYVYIA
jgi:hypothetical protein